MFLDIQEGGGVSIFIFHAGFRDPPAVYYKYVLITYNMLFPQFVNHDIDYSSILIYSLQP